MSAAAPRGPADAPTGASGLKLLWVNEEGSFVGGCERYVADTAALLTARGVTSTLLYDVNRPVDPAFLGAFAAAFPLVAPARQIAALAPDVIYVHRVTRAATVTELAQAGVPAARFIHDHRIFCLREHKYTTIGHRTCTRPTGPACYPCLGFVHRRRGWPGFGLRGLAQLEAEQAATRLLDAVVVGSDYMADHVARHGFDRARVHVLPLYTPPPTVTAADARPAGQLLFVGQLIRGKGLDLALRALARCRTRPTLEVIGNGRQEGQLRALSRQLGLDAQVRFVGARSGTALAERIAAATALLVPSRAPETFALVGPEAMSLATPVIGTRVGGIGQWLEDGLTGLSVPPDAPAALAAAIDRLVGDPALARRLGRAGRARYDERFTPERHLAALHRLLARLAARGGGDDGPA